MGFFAARYLACPSLPVPKHILDYLPGFHRHGMEERVSGACPWCGGTDRFVVFPDQGPEGTGSFYCFDNPGNGCGKGGDLIEFLRIDKDLSYVEACKEAGLESMIDGEGPEAKRMRTEARASDAALEIKKIHIEKQRLLEKRKEQERRRKARRKRMKQKERERFARGMNAKERWLLEESRTYRTARRALRMVARFVTLHAEQKSGGPSAGQYAPPGLEESPEEFETGGGKPVSLAAPPREVLQDEERFPGAEELRDAVASGLSESLRQAAQTDDRRSSARVEKLMDLSGTAQMHRIRSAQAAGQRLSEAEVKGIIGSEKQAQL